MSAQYLSFFVLLDDRTVQAIPLRQDVQEEMSALFIKQRDELLAVEKQIEFAPGWNPAEDEVFMIPDYAMADAILEALRLPSSQQRFLNMDEETLESIVGIFTGQSDPAWVVLQTFDRRRLLWKQTFSIINEKGAFKRLDEPGLTLDTKAAAVWDKQRLVFRSYAVTTRLLDLTAYFREATNDDLREMAQHERLSVKNVDTLIDGADDWTRKKFALIKKSGVLDKTRLADAKQIAGVYQVPLVVKKNKIELPEDKKELKDVLRFLDEDYFTSILTQQQFITNSKRLLKAKNAAAKKAAAKKAPKAAQVP